MSHNYHPHASTYLEDIKSCSYLNFNHLHSLPAYLWYILTWYKIWLGSSMIRVSIWINFHQSTHCFKLFIISCQETPCFFYSCWATLIAESSLTTIKKLSLRLDLSSLSKLKFKLRLGYFKTISTRPRLGSTWSSSSTFFTGKLKASNNENKKERSIWEVYLGGEAFLLNDFQHLWGFFAFYLFLHKQVHNEKELHSQRLHISSQALKVESELKS